MIFLSLHHQAIPIANKNCMASITSVWSRSNYMPKASGGQLGKGSLGPGMFRAFAYVGVPSLTQRQS